MNHKKRRGDLGEVYHHICDCMINYFPDPNRLITFKNIILILGRFMHIGCPERRFKIFRELLEYGYIERTGKTHDGVIYKVLG